MPAEPPDNATPAILRNADTEYVAYTSQASTVARSLLLSAVAIAWFFAGSGVAKGASASTTFHQVQSHTPLAVALWLAIAGLLADLIHYALGAALWGLYRWIWRTVLFNDGPTVEASDDAKRAWRMAERWDVVATINGEVSAYDEKEAGSARPGISEQAAVASAKLHGVQGTQITGSNWSPPFMNGVTTCLFIAKVILTAGSYVALLVAAAT